MSNLFKYYLKKRLPIICIITGVMLAILCVSVLCNPYISYEYDHITGKQFVEVADNSPLGVIATFICILVSVIPVLEFKFKMTKISVDLYYQLPVKREKLFLTKYLVGLVEFIIPTLICYLVCLISIVTSNHLFEMQYFFMHIGAIILLGIVLYTTFVFLYTRANSIVDGIVNMCLWTFFFIAVFSALFRLTNTSIDLSFFFTYSPIASTNYVLEAMFLNDKISRYEFDTLWFILVLFSILGIISFILFIIFSKKEKAEDSMQITNSYFSYNMLVPVMSSTTLFCVEGESIIFLIVIAVLGYVLYVIQHKTFKVGIKKIIILLVCCIVSYILGGLYY